MSTYDPNTDDYNQTGGDLLSFGDRCAIAAMSVLLKRNLRANDSVWIPHDVAEDAFLMADAMLAERNKKKAQP